MEYSEPESGCSDWSNFPKAFANDNPSGCDNNLADRLRGLPYERAGKQGVMYVFVKSRCQKIFTMLAVLLT